MNKKRRLLGKKNQVQVPLVRGCTIVKIENVK